MEDTELAARHIELRERAGLTQEQEAKIAQVSPTTISGIESGKITRPHFRTILKLAQALDVRPEELSRREPKKEQPPLPFGAGNGGTFDELLESSGLTDTPLARDAQELNALFDSLDTYEEARTLATEVVEARQVINPILERRHTLPPGPELGQLNRLWHEAFTRTAVAVLRHQGAADREAERLRRLGEAEQASRVDVAAERLVKAA